MSGKEGAMKILLRLAVGAGLAAWTLGAAAGPASASSDPEEAGSVIADWPEPSQLAARKVMEKYGSPDAFSSILLTWNDTGPWKRILVYRNAGTNELGVGPADILQQFVRREVPVARWRALTAFGRGVAYDPQKGELSARSDSEEKNFLALNLADEIVRGKKDAQAAQRFYEKTLALSLSGKSSRYMNRLLFAADRARK